MGAESWIRRASGLLVPRLNFSKPHPHPCPKCCTEGEEDVCECLCHHCHDGTAACCYQIDMNAFSATDPEQCDECPELNRDYRLTQVDDVGSACVWKHYLIDSNCEGEDVCGITVATLELDQDESNDYVWTFTLGDNVWELNVGSEKPQCCRSPYNDGTAVMTNIASMAECDIDDETNPVILQSISSEGCGNPESNDCSDEIEGTQPCCMQLDISGVTYDSPPGDANTCLHCTCFNRDWLISHADIDLFPGKACAWSGSLTNEFCESISFQMRVTQVDKDTIGLTGDDDLTGFDYEVRVEVGSSTWGFADNVVYRKYYDEPPVLANFVNEDIPYLSGGGVSIADDCDFTGSSLKLTARLGLDPAECVQPTFGSCPWCLCKIETVPDIKLTIADLVNDDCEDCGDINGEYVLTYRGYNSTTKICLWRYTPPSPLCNTIEFDFELRYNDVALRMEYTLVIQLLFGENFVSYTLHEVEEFRALDCENFLKVLPFSIPDDPDTECVWADATITVENT